MKSTQEDSCIEATGAWPFISRRVYKLSNDMESVWTSRHHRKSFGAIKSEGALSWLWMPQQLNWWIGFIFAIGSFLFALASVLSLAPALAKAWSLDSSINGIFFAGSIPFTTAAWLQLFQAANADDSGWRLFGWRPHDVGWLSCAFQFAGTILFNVNTFDAMIPGLNWFRQDLAIWAPDIIGSILFLVSGYLAFIESCHAHWAIHPKELSWWVVFTNLVGCIGFMASALFAISLPSSPENWGTISAALTLAGAINFLVGSLLMLPEAGYATRDT